MKTYSNERIYYNQKHGKKMAHQYRSEPAGGLNPKNNQKQKITEFIHFTLEQFFELLMNNKIVTGSDTVDNIIENKTNFGIKLYFAQHAEAGDCPDNDENYIGSNTIVIGNTINKNSIWYDMPDSNNQIPDIQEYVSADSGSLLDKGTRCPPDCPPFSNSL